MNAPSFSAQLRSPRYVGQIAGVLIASLLLACGLLAINRSNGAIDYALEHPADPLTDDQAKAQVVEPARQIGSIAKLALMSGGYTLMSCMNETDPPYQGEVFANFDLPSDAVGYFEKIAAEMVALGWTGGMPPNQNLPGKTLSKNGVTAIFYRNSDYIRLGTVKIYGECRDISDHRRDATVWVDITDQLH